MITLSVFWHSDNLNFLVLSSEPIFTIFIFIFADSNLMNMEEQKAIVEETEQTKDFSGNYIENFQRDNERERFPGKLVDWEKKDHCLYFYGEECTLELMVLSQDIIRFRYGNDGNFESDFSYAIDPDFKPENQHF